MRVRGLKFTPLATAGSIPAVAPHAGAWIEIVRDNVGNKAKLVAPHAGAWIEICRIEERLYAVMSHPMRVRGLKSICPQYGQSTTTVAPHAGAWIEIGRRGKR